MRSNEAINALYKAGVSIASKYGAKDRGFFSNVGSALLSPLELSYRTYRTGNIGEGFAKTYGKDQTFMLGKAVGGVVGGVVGLRVGLGALRGGFTDGQGNIDVPGIPLI